MHSQDFQIASSSFYSESKRPRTPRSSLVSLLLSASIAGGCTSAPEFDGPNQVPDANVTQTALKDNHFEKMSWTDLDTLIIDALVPNPESEPGCAVGVVRDDEIIYLQGYGFAQLPYGAAEAKPWGVSTMGAVGSISKTLTAAAMLKMIEDGDLDLDDRVDEYLATSNLELGDRTLESLINHTSGIGGDDQGLAFAPNFPTGSDARDCQLDPEAQPAGFCAGVAAELASPLAAFEVYEATEPVAFFSSGGSVESGVYSNVGISVAGAVIDALAPDVSSSDGYEQYVWNEIGQWSDNPLEGGNLKSLALTHSWRATDIPNRAVGYGDEPYFPVYEAWENTAGMEGWEGPSGGWAMTIGDLSRFMIAMNENHLFENAATLNAMRAENTDLIGLSFNYAMGMFTGGGGIESPDYHHGGDIGGHHAYWAWWDGIQGQDIGIALICNRDDLNSNTLNGLITWQSGEGMSSESTLIGIVLNQNPDPPSEISFAPVLEEEVEGVAFSIDMEKAWVVGGQQLALPVGLDKLHLMLAVDEFDQASGAPLFQFGEVDPDSGAEPKIGKPLTLRSDSYRNPDFKTWPVSMTLGEMSTEIALEEMVLEGAFGEGGKSIEALSMTALFDVRQAGLFGYEPSGQAACSDVRRAGGECVPCADGAEVCVGVRFEGLSGVPVPEPGFGALLATGLFGLTLQSRVRRGRVVGASTARQG